MAHDKAGINTDKTILLSSKWNTEDDIKRLFIQEKANKAEKLAKAVFLFAVVGHPGSGKDTVADFLRQQFRFQSMALADPLREVVARIYPLDLHRLKFDLEYKETPMGCLGGHTPRQALQIIGTEGFRRINRKTWTNYLERLIFHQPRSVVVTDLRFEDEYDWFVKEMGGTVIAIDRKSAEEAISSRAPHSSEEFVPELIKRASYSINNNGTKEELMLEVELFMDRQLDNLE